MLLINFSLSFLLILHNQINYLKQIYGERFFNVYFWVKDGPKVQFSTFLKLEVSHIIHSYFSAFLVCLLKKIPFFVEESEKKHRTISIPRMYT
jgi:hypothetical protein